MVWANVFSLILRFRNNEEGQDLIEYALISATIAVVVAGFLPITLMPAVSSIFSKIASSVAAS
ncbi:MAG: Flp family type IVb pilin [Bryobacteraceae bacterium]